MKTYPSGSCKHNHGNNGDARMKIPTPIGPAQWNPLDQKMCLLVAVVSPSGSCPGIPGDSSF